MKKSTLLSIFVCVCLFLVQSCKKDLTSKSSISENAISGNSEVNKLQITFANILAKAVKNDAPLRSFLKEESLKQFDNDHDILYQMVKDKKINNLETLHEKLIRFASSKAELETIEQKLPLLTIFVPTLVNFSPESWNADTEVPVVAATNALNKGFSFYDNQGKEVAIAPNEIPAFPLVLIKLNERVVVGSNTTSTSKASSSTNSKSPIVYNDGSLVLSFADEAFDNINSKVITDKVKPSRVTDASGIDAVNINAYNSGTDWQRDYVYYGITPSQPVGQFKNNYSEFITSMKFSTNAISKMSDQDGDPRSTDGQMIGRPSSNGYFWTEGNYEFTITVLINSKNGIGNDLSKVISVKPTDLYDVQGKLRQEFAYYFYQVTSITPKEYHPNVELVPWDLQNYGTAWKFVVYENDNAQEVTQSYENTTTYATNFELTAPFNKVGTKFGASATTTEKRTYSVKTTLNSDFIGEATLSFDQPIIISNNNGSYTTREITTGNLLSMSIEPKKVF
ncbi:hypothetical protein [uncultured Mucilaginibacter sp.]|uniref:hypothetical protein n=1 Tax=uncultured Mucilaginibacter sp. TaxID=797541 RepID=UPI002629D76D|nr:hypothetical protein [uncultured Mucilaginibacter sp.]